MKIKRAIFVITIISIILSSCSNVGMDSVVGVDKKFLNKALNLSIIQEWTSFNRSEVVAINIKNISNKLITIPIDKGVRIFVQEGKEWVEIDQQHDDYYEQNQQNLYLLPGEYIPYEFSGNFPDTDEDIRVRVYVLGWEGNESNPLGAFIEIKLH